MGSGFICVKIFSNNFFPVKQRGQYRWEEAKVKTENVAATPEFSAAYKRPPSPPFFALFASSSACIWLKCSWLDASSVYRLSILFQGRDHVVHDSQVLFLFSQFFSLLW